MVWLEKPSYAFWYMKSLLNINAFAEYDLLLTIFIIVNTCNHFNFIE